MPDGVTTAAPAGQVVKVQLLGEFVMFTGDGAGGDGAGVGGAVGGGRVAGPWPRPSARRLCELLLVSPGRRIRRDVACEELFGDRDQRAAARALSKALSMARSALGELGAAGGSLLAADLTHIWVAGCVEVDAEVHAQALRAALAAAGGGRAGRLRAALAVAEGELLAGEPDEEWARLPRERLAGLRQEARLALARELASGRGTAGTVAASTVAASTVGAGTVGAGADEVLAAWQCCLDHDPACEEAAGALVRGYLARGRPEQAARVLQRCRAALEELGLRLSPSLESACAAVASRAQPVPHEERRPVSVLFAEVAASPAAAGMRDPEALRESVGGVLAAVITEVEALGGTVVSVSGRGLQALFGVPAAHEDDPERAVRAAYRAAVRAPSATALRIGVESGPAVVGPVGGGARAEYAVFGDVASVAAGLQSAARPGSVLVGPVTRAATDHLFTWSAAEKLELDLGGEPVEASYLDAPRAKPGGRRPALGGTATLAGRDAEMRVLARALRELGGGHGSVVALTGEPGIGKTRLTQEARRRFLAWAGAGTGRLPLWLEGRCSSYASDTPYGLYRDLLASWTGVSPDQPAALRGSALERALVRLMGNANLLPPLARLAGLSGVVTAGRDAAPAGRPAGPAETQRMVFGAMRALVTRLTAVAPTVLVLEDLHWADPTSLHLTRHLAELTRDRPLLMLVTARHEAIADVSSIAPDVREVRLRPLPAAGARALARSLIGEAAEDVLDAVIAPAGGNPLFLEERLAALLETSGLVRDRGAWAMRDTGDPQLSQVLERLVRSRIDRLSPGAQTAVRAASVLGFEFREEQLSAMLNGDRPGALDTVLDELVASDLIHHRVSRGPESAFTFRHAVLGEAVYLGLLRSERRALHARAAAAIESAQAGAVAEVAAVLGRHYASAGLIEQAVRFLEMAGDHATDTFANDEAIASFRTAIELTGGHAALADTAVRLYDKMANVLWRTNRRAATRQAFRDALGIADAAGTVSALQRVHLHIRLGRICLPDGLLADAAAAFDAAEELLGDDPGGRDDATVDQWLELLIEGRADMYGALDPDRVEAVLDQARPLLETRGTPARKSDFYRYLAQYRIVRNGMRPGADDIELLRRGLEWGRQTGEAKDAAYAAHVLGWALGLRGDLAAARTCQEEAVDLAERIGESNLLPMALTGLALIALHQDDEPAARSALARAIVAVRESERDEDGGGCYAVGEPAVRLILTWLDRPPGGQAEALADELARLMGTAGMPWVLYLARGLSAPA